MRALAQRSYLSRDMHASCCLFPPPSLPSAVQKKLFAFIHSHAGDQAYFVKQLGASSFDLADHDTAGQVTSAPEPLARGGAHSKGGDMKDWPAALLVREDPQIGPPEVDQAVTDPVTDPVRVKRWLALRIALRIRHGSVTDRVTDPLRIRHGSVTDSDTDQRPNSAAGAELGDCHYPCRDP